MRLAWSGKSKERVTLQGRSWLGNGHRERQSEGDELDSGSYNHSEDARDGVKVLYVATVSRTSGQAALAKFANRK